MKNGEQMEKRNWGFAEWLFTGFALICLVLALCSNDGYKTVFDHFSPDGNMERITPELILIFRICFAVF